MAALKNKFWKTAGEKLEIPVSQHRLAFSSLSKKIHA